MTKSLAVCGLLLLAVALVFGQTVRFDFVNLDNTAVVSGNRHLTAGPTAEAVTWAFTHRYLGLYAPVTWLSHMLDCQVYGLARADTTSRTCSCTPLRRSSFFSCCAK